MELTRNFTVVGRIVCDYDPESETSTAYMPGMEVELWHKSPLEATFLSKATTDAEGRFEALISEDSPFIVDGKINDVFLKISYNGILITGDNPY